MGVDSRLTFFRKDKKWNMFPLRLKGVEPNNPPEFIETINITKRSDIELIILEKHFKHNVFNVRKDIKELIYHLSEDEKKEILKAWENDPKNKGYTIDTMLKFIQDSNEVGYKFRKQKREEIYDLYEDEFNLKQNIYGIEKYIPFVRATEENTPKWLWIDYKYNAYWLPKLVRLSDLVFSETEQYDKVEQHYLWLYEKLVEYYKDSDEVDIENDLDNIYMVMEIF